MKMAIVGSRSFDDFDYLQWVLDYVLEIETSKIGVYWQWESVEVVSGGARGSDRLAEMFANKRKLGLTVFSADWDKYGRSAGYRRNKRIVDYADIIIAFWDSKSKGTKHTINLARKQGKPTFIFTDWSRNGTI